jgi:hypothetical protein
MPFTGLPFPIEEYRRRQAKVFNGKRPEIDALLSTSW